MKRKNSQTSITSMVSLMNSRASVKRNLNIGGKKVSSSGGGGCGSAIKNEERNKGSESKGYDRLQSQLKSQSHLQSH